eukprot:2785379-Amphidinium_carterae.1
MGVSGTIIEVLFNSLALLFLFDLADLNGPFGFVFSGIDWPDQGLAVLHAELDHRPHDDWRIIVHALTGMTVMFLLLLLLFHLIFFFMINWPALAITAPSSA